MVIKRQAKTYRGRISVAHYTCPCKWWALRGKIYPLGAVRNLKKSKQVKKTAPNGNLPLFFKQVKGIAKTCNFDFSNNREARFLLASISTK